MIFFPFIIFITAAAIPFIDIAHAFPAQSNPSPSASPDVFAKPGTLMGKPYIVHDHADPAFGTERRSQPDQHSEPGDIARDGPLSRAARFDHSRRVRRGISEGGPERGENLLSDVHPQPPTQQASATTTDSTSTLPSHNTSITLIPRPTSTPKVVKAESKTRKHVAGPKKSKSTRAKKE